MTKEKYNRKDMLKIFFYAFMTGVCIGIALMGIAVKIGIVVY